MLFYMHKKIIFFTTAILLPVTVLATTSARNVEHRYDQFGFSFQYTEYSDPSLSYDGNSLMQVQFADCPGCAEGEDTYHYSINTYNPSQLGEKLFQIENDDLVIIEDDFRREDGTRVIEYASGGMCGDRNALLVNEYTLLHFYGRCASDSSNVIAEFQYWLSLITLYEPLEIDNPIFHDVPSTHPYFEAIEWAGNFKIPAPTQNPPYLIEGYSDGTFRPDNTINRAEFLKIIIDASGNNLGGYTGISLATIFSDVEPGVWYATHLKSAKSLGIISGYPDGTFRPGNSISFAEAAKIVLNAFFGAREQLRNDEAWHVEYIQNLSQIGAIPPGVNSPAHSMTRGEMVEMMHRIHLNK
jgi:hypothetical protein